MNGSLRRELLNAYVFKTISEVREKTEEWMLDYNTNRPHKSLNYQPPVQVGGNKSYSDKDLAALAGQKSEGGNNFYLDDKNEKSNFETNLLNGSKIR